MKRTLFTAIAVAAITLAGCKKDSSNKPSSSTSDSYFPSTKGSTWTYNDITAGVTDTRSLTVTGATTQLNGKTYYNVDVVTHTNGSGTAYLSTANHTYTMRMANNTVGITLELPLCKDDQNAGYSWTSSPTDDGTVEGFPAKLINTIKEKGISKMVNGRNYDNVIHTQVELQYDLGGGFTTAGTYDFFLAKGIGLIAEDFTINGANYETETLSSYSVK